MPKKNPLSMRLTDDALAAIDRLKSLTGLERSAVVETAVRRMLDQEEKKSQKVKVKG